ncbi:MAG: sigma factor-like helix-turn-helix DNA-binding protein [Actinomycetota bacterium]|nr:sigma factor-like helix-turn-helix DNA-binding protein [Actinomycetota bacterium]
MSFETFATRAGPRLRAGLVAAYGPEVGADAAAEALAYGWEHWARLSAMANPAGYLYRVGQTAARRSRRPQGYLPAPASGELPEVEPGLVPALEDLTEMQRTCVLLVHAFGWSQTEAAELLDVEHSTVRTHLARGLEKLQAALEVERHV